MTSPCQQLSRRASHPAATATAAGQQLRCDTDTKLRSSNLHSNVHPIIVPAPAILSRSCGDQASRTRTTCNTIHSSGYCTKGKHARQHQGTKQRLLPPAQSPKSEDLLQAHLCMRTRGIRWQQGMPPSLQHTVLHSCKPVQQHGSTLTPQAWPQPSAWSSFSIVLLPKHHAEATHHA